MTQQTPDLHIIVERLEKLEHHNRWKPETWGQT